VVSDVAAEGESVDGDVVADPVASEFYSEELYYSDSASGSSEASGSLSIVLSSS
jgi:hypothetical protein